ncbi:MAG: HAMP domain-containing histidine kinase [Eubacterium sp.]|nr:HAMP domain-containing histidine kinase [Eubacterium sp.]
MNIVFGFSILITIFIFIYIKRSVIRPFYSMERLANDLAGGNLSKPVKEERSRIFGKFLWSIDMLREKLEQSREKEMAYMKERKTLMLSLSHDIKTPLSAIELYTKALSTGLYDTDEKKNEAYLGIENNLNDLKNYIDEITAASKDDFMLLEVKDDEIYLSSVLKPIKDYYLEKFEHLHTIFEIAPTNDILVKGDRDRLVEVMQNILENAIKYGDGRCVDISFSEEEDAKLVHIHNTGMPPEENDMVHLFDSFYRGSNSEKKKGSGLGLYISRQLMKRMDGDIYATATKDGFEAVVVIMKA